MRGYGAFCADERADWQPGQDRRDRSRLLAAMTRWGFPSLETLHACSVDDPERFWRLVLDDLAIDFDAPFTSVRDDGDGHHLPRWFVGGRLNVADLCVLRHSTGPHSSKTALVYEGETAVRSMTYRELADQVRLFAAGLRARGVGPGDRVVLFLPVVPEAAVAYFATAMIGAVVVPAFTGLGAEGLASRIRSAEPKVVVTSDATSRRGKSVRLKETVEEALRTTDVDVAVVVVVVTQTGNPAAAQGKRDIPWADMLTEPALERSTSVPADHPLALIFTSGTTGTPKGIVLSHAGFAVKAATDFAYGFDAHESDVVAWIADMGWMLGPLLLMSVLQLGATLVMVEGVPDFPNPQRLWDIVGRHGVTIQGIAPTAARLLRAQGALPAGDIASVHTFASTGEAWDGPTWEWLFHEVGGGSRPIVNYTGGTETGGGILISYPFLPGAAGAFNGPLPGMDVGVLDPDGAPLVGAVGELVIFNTWPGMTHGFWNDRERYRETYWARWPDVWVHGDLASVDASGSWLLHGRSDDTIKVAGRRVGPAELEAALMLDSRVAEAAVVGVPDPMRGERVAAFLVVRETGIGLADLSAAAESNVGRSFAPEVNVVPGLPKTKNGKIMRRAIRARYLGSEAGDLSSLDPATPLDLIPVRATMESTE